MFRSLTLRSKILALPMVASLGFIATLATTIVLGRRAQSELSLLQRQAAPALDASRRLEAGLDTYHRTLRDAVTSSDTLSVIAADSVSAGFIALADTLAVNPAADAAMVLSTTIAM